MRLNFVASDDYQRIWFSNEMRQITTVTVNTKNAPPTPACDLDVNGANHQYERERAEIKTTARQTRRIAPVERQKESLSLAVAADAMTKPCARARRRASRNAKTSRAPRRAPGTRR